MQTTLIPLLFLAFGLTLIAGGDQAQVFQQPGLSDPKTVAENLRGFYSKHDYVYHELSYTLYANHDTNTPHSVETGVFIQQGKIRYSRMGSIESLSTPEYALGVDNEDQVLLLANTIALPANTDPMDMLSAWTVDPKLAQVKYLSEQHDALAIQMEDGEIAEAELVYDKLSFQLVKLTLKYRRSITLEADEDAPLVQPRMEINYRKITLEKKRDAQLELDNYVRRKGSNWEPAPRYQAYEFINNIRELPAQN